MLAALFAVALTSSQARPQGLEYRWVYVMTNLYRKEEAERVAALIRKAAPMGYNGFVIADTKLQSQVPVPEFYEKNLKLVAAAAAETKTELIPSIFSYGYSNSMLFRDPNLVEGMPIKNAPFLVRNGEAWPIQDAAIANGEFEIVKGDRFEGFAFQDGIGTATFADGQTVHGGSTSLRMVNPGSLKETSGNCRVMQAVTVAPWRQYKVSTWVKTTGFQSAGDVAIKVIDPAGKSLTYQNLNIPKDQDWTQVQIVFNSQKNTSVNVYFGVWNGTGGTLWVDDLRIEDPGLLNVIRRARCPLTVIGENGMQYVEGRDFEPVIDPKFGNDPWNGEYKFAHQGPPIRLKAGSRIKEGERLSVSFSAAVTVYDGQAAICMSDPKADQLAREEAAQAKRLFDAKSFFFGYDELRVMNWCESCRRTGKTPGQLLAAHIAKSIKKIGELSPTARIFVWSDMFDPYHNAAADYYLVNGELRGSWANLPKNLTVVNWNRSKSGQSLAFFSKMGVRQILAGYYDGSPGDIAKWLQEAVGLPGISGVMYTTWKGDYKGLEQFAASAWGK